MPTTYIYPFLSIRVHLKTNPTNYDYYLRHYKAYLNEIEDGNMIGEDESFI